MTEFDKNFEKDCEKYLEYLYLLVEKYYNDCSDIDSLVQDTLTAFLLKISKGEAIEHPKGFLSAVLKNKYNAYLREKYKAETVEFPDGVISETNNEFEEKEENERLAEEYESIRREISRLIRIYREVTVRHYVHGQSIDQISKELGIPRGTVLSRLSSARSQIKEGVENVEKYSQISYEPKSGQIGIRGWRGLSGEPTSLISSDIEANILYLAYENPVSIRGIADTMGMPCAYIEPIIDKLIQGELMGKTSGGLVYTRCFMQRYEDFLGDIPVQEKLAEKYASKIWEIVWKHLEPLTLHDDFAQMSDKQKATMILLVMDELLNDVLHDCCPNREKNIYQLPERPNAGKWLATMIVTDYNQEQNNKYIRSGPVNVSYSQNSDKNYDCKMFDLDSLFGDAHLAYRSFKYKCSLQSILRFYASFLPCDIKTDNNHLYELIPEFEKLGILKRGTDDEMKLDIPALPFSELTNYWEPAKCEIKKELAESLAEPLTNLWLNRKNRVPKHIDAAEQFAYYGAAGSYVLAQLLAIVNQNLLPYPVVVGKTPLIYIAYRKKET